MVLASGVSLVARSIRISAVIVDNGMQMQYAGRNLGKEMRLCRRRGLLLPQTGRPLESGLWAVCGVVVRGQSAVGKMLSHKRLLAHVRLFATVGAKVTARSCSR